MPELPEVETIRRQASAKLIGKSVVSIEQNEHGVLQGETEVLLGQRIQTVRRFGKLLVIDFSGDHSVTIHLKMTGRLTLLDEDMLVPPHTHVMWQFSDGSRLSFSDSRRFGYMHIVKTTAIESLPFVKKLGPEPLSTLTLALFTKLCQSTKRPIKTLLLDQQRIAGIGNIYACESLWIAKIHPKRAAQSLKVKERKKLFEAIGNVLEEGLSRGGASDNSYRNLFGGKGEYQNFFKVYMRKGKPCARCGTPISFSKLAGRGTFFCKVCQKM